MTRRWLRDRGGFLALALLSLLTACSEESIPPDAIAQVGGELITAADFDGYLDETLGGEAASLPTAARSALLDLYLEEAALARLAEERGLGSDADDAETRRQVVERMVAEAAGGAPRERDLHEAFEALRAEGSLDEPARVRLRQILVQERAVAEEARAEIVAGADFGVVAERLSADPSSAIGGDQGALSRDDLPKALADDIFRLEAGEVSPVIEAEYGYHLFQVIERLPPRRTDYAAARPALEERLSRERADAALAALVAEARKRYDVEVYARNLPFDYRGAYHEEIDPESDADPRPDPPPVSP